MARQRTRKRSLRLKKQSGDITEQANDQTELKSKRRWYNFWNNPEMCCKSEQWEHFSRVIFVRYRLSRRCPRTQQVSMSYCY
mmetsp:Transcript_7379/g.8083  ORF Transcript_7379/g.8083 Transcript_7379/m.8083 type:complete len:82 (-) Transcript_7379:32-277(-)